MVWLMFFLGCQLCNNAEVIANYRDNVDKLSM